MNTPTPRTNEGEWDITSYDARQPEMVVTSFLARALERELAALTEAQNLESAIWESLKTAISERNQLIAEVEALKQSIESGQRVLRSALQNLADEQNGAPLETRRDEWQAAMDEAHAALAATEEAK